MASENNFVQEYAYIEDYICKCEKCTKQMQLKNSEESNEEIERGVLTIEFF